MVAQRDNDTQLRGVMRGLSGTGKLGCHGDHFDPAPGDALQVIDERSIRMADPLGPVHAPGTLLR